MFPLDPKLRTAARQVLAERALPFGARIHGLAALERAVYTWHEADQDAEVRVAAKRVLHAAPDSAEQESTLNELNAALNAPF